MEIAWKVTNFFIGLLLIGLCSGFPIGLENSAADYHTQFLTGLVGVLLTVCGVVFLVGCLCCQRKNGFKEFHNNPVVASSASSLDHGHINPIANGEFTIFTPLSPPHHNNNVFLANEQIVGQTEIDYNHADIDVRSWFDGTERDFPRTKLKYIKELGKGWFGGVVEGTAQGLNGSNDDSWMPVAVRILEASATSSERAVFLHDAKIYRCGSHPHILQLLGRSLESVPLLLLQELCPCGDLKKYLSDNRGTAEKLLSSDLPLLWCCQLSSAIKHLHDYRLTHPDLAARNCQIVSDLSLKLGDYGLAASLYPEDYYQGAPAVPVRWCAPESITYTSTTIQPKQTTFESNVWSLGITMWEIYTCGAQPYSHLSDDDVISQVLGSANVRLVKPDLSTLYTDYIFRLMQLCWSTSESRPSVSQVHLMLTDLMQVYQNTKDITHSEPLSIQDFDKRWDNFKPNSVSRIDNQEFNPESKSLADVDLSDVTILNMNLNNDEELLNTKPMSPSLNNLHGSLDNLTGEEMDSWLQKVANKTGDMSYVHGLSEAIKDLDNALALENVSSSDSSHQPSPAPENIPKIKNKLEFKLGPTTQTSNDSNNKTQNSSLTESMQRTSSESETEDENWRRKIERGAYSEKVHQKSKSVTDLMVLTHIDCSESDSETPLPSLDYRVNYRNVRYAPKQNLENASLMFGSEGNLLSIHDKFQEELKRLQEERKDSLLFVPESNSHKDDKPNKNYNDKLDDPLRRTENSSSDEETSGFCRNENDTCTYVNTPSTNVGQQNSNTGSKTASPNHRNPESLIEELSSPADIQPANQVYNIFNVTVDSSFSPMHIRPDLKDIICFEESQRATSVENGDVDAVTKDLSESPKQIFQVPKLTEIIQNNDNLIDYIISKYESQENLNSDEIAKLECEAENSRKELNNNLQNSLVLVNVEPSESLKNIQTVTHEFLQKEQEHYEGPTIQPKFDVSQTQEKVLPSTMTHSAVFSSTPFAKRTLESCISDKPSINFDLSSEHESEILQFSSNFADFEEEEEEVKSEMKYSLETWDNFLGKALECPGECNEFEDFSSEPQSLLFVDGKDILDTESVECKNGALIERFNRDENDLRVELVDIQEDVSLREDIVQNVNIDNEEGKAKERSVLNVDETVIENLDKTITLQNVNKTFTCEDVDLKDVTVVLADDNELLDRTYDKKHEAGSSSSNWEPGEGWFLHPQTNTEVSGQMEVSQGNSGDTESYVGFSMDDEIMAAIRNELLMKLPQAQGQSSEQLKDSDEWDAEGRSEVLIKYNVYTTPLSPIPEESYSENDSHHLIYNRQDSSDSENGDWPEPYQEHNSGLADTETQSMQNRESPIQEPPHRHTPSQDSCCSNDTLFNLEELTYVLNENENCEKKDNEENEALQIDEVSRKDVDEETLKGEKKEETDLNDVGNELSPAVEKEIEEDEVEFFRKEVGIDQELINVNDKQIEENTQIVENIVNGTSSSTETKNLQNTDMKETAAESVVELVEENENIPEARENEIEESQVKIAKSLLKISGYKEEESTKSNPEEGQDNSKKDPESEPINALIADNHEVNNLEIKTEQVTNENTFSNNIQNAASILDGDIYTNKEVELKISNIPDEIGISKNEITENFLNMERADSENDNRFSQKEKESGVNDDINVNKTAFSLNKEAVIKYKEEISLIENENKQTNNIKSISAENELKSNSEEFGNISVNDSNLNINGGQIKNDFSQRIDVGNENDLIEVNGITDEQNEYDTNSIEFNSIDVFNDYKSEIKVNGIQPHINEEVNINKAEIGSERIPINGSELDIEETENGATVTKLNEVNIATNEILSEKSIKSEVSLVKNEFNPNKANKVEDSQEHLLVVVNDDNKHSMDKNGCEIAVNENDFLLNFNECKDELSVLVEEPRKDITSIPGITCDINEVNVEDINVNFIYNEEADENTSAVKYKVNGEDNIKKSVNDTDKLIIKNVQNELVIPENKSKWIDNSDTAVDENDVNLLNLCENFNNKLENINSDNITVASKQTKEIKQTNEDSDVTKGFSLLVENNPNYVTEFLNHERQSSISSLGSSRDDDDYDFNQSGLSNHVSISLQNNKNLTLATDNNEIDNSQHVSDRDYVNISDITLKLVDDLKPSDTVIDELQIDGSSQPDYVNVVREDVEEHLYDPVAGESVDADIYDAFTDIRFTGPSDIQLMSTSFSESADIDEQDWDSGSDTRSSSSGEFIWKEGEHEESVKALRAAPQDVSNAEKIIHMEDIEEVTSESSDEDEEGDSPEFVPSAWDKYATPTKSALRSPEKTLEKSEVKHKKSKGVWFKKQKYHCVYEYPREPESPSVNSYELWQPVSTSLIDWEVDTSPYIPTLDATDSNPDNYQHLDKQTRNLYQFADFTSGMSALDDEFFISSTARPFEAFGGHSSQFFPGQNMSDQWMDLTKQPNENITPDSGVEDITPASNIDGNEFLQEPPKSHIQSLKTLAAAAVKQNPVGDVRSNSKGSMGGLRHARNKLKLDLPPSPSAFTSTKAFTIEPPEEPVTKREVPTFTTFGKSRFLVQHVDTPTCDEENEIKNVSFEALPYKPIQINLKTDKAKVEIVRGEASLLDSADEDSGIESSTLERKKITNIAE